MPVYEYVCRKCHKKFMEVLTFKEHDTKKIRCPKCKSEETEKVIEPFVAIRQRRVEGKPRDLIGSEGVNSRGNVPTSGSRACRSGGRVL